MGITQMFKRMNGTLRRIISVAAAISMAFSLVMLSPVMSKADVNEPLSVRLELRKFCNQNDNTFKGSIDWEIEYKDSKPNTYGFFADSEYTNFSDSDEDGWSNCWAYLYETLVPGDVVTFIFKPIEGYELGLFNTFGTSEEIISRSENKVTVVITEGVSDYHIEAEIEKKGGNNPGGNEPGGQPSKSFVSFEGDTETILMEDGEFTDAYENLNEVKEGKIRIEKDGEWARVYIKNLGNKNDERPSSIWFGGDISLIVEGENYFNCVNLKDKTRVEVDGWVRDKDGNPPQLNVAHGFVCPSGTANELRFSGQVLVNIGTKETPTADAFYNINRVDIRNYEFHNREWKNVVIYAVTAFYKVDEVAIRSSKVEMHKHDMEVGGYKIKLVEEANTAIKLLEEAQLEVEINDINDFGLENASVFNYYYKSYPGGKIDSSEVVDCLAVGYMNADYKNEAGFELDNSISNESTFPIKDNDNRFEINYDSDNKLYKIKNTDPILFSVSYEIDGGIDFPNPDCGTLELNGYEKGFYTICKNRDDDGEHFEAWICPGETVNVTILPNAGYQYQKDTLNINGQIIPNNTPGEARGTYSFVMPENAGHICAGFAKTDDAVINESKNVKSAEVADTEGIAQNGNVKLELSDANVSSEDAAKLQAAAGEAIVDEVLDIDLSEMVVKNYDPNAKEQQSWDTPLTDLSKPVTIEVALSEKLEAGETVEVVREHDGKCEILKSSYDAATGTISFATDKFSTYAIAKNKKPDDKKPDDKKLANVTLDKKSYAYTGKQIKPKCTVTDDKGNKISSDCYTVKLANNKNIGKATVTITGKNGYTGTKKLTFTIVPAKVKSISTAKSTAKKKITLKWKKSLGAAGYEINLSTNKNFKKAVKKISIKSAKTLKKTITGLKGGKSYYVRIRGYKKVGKKTYYSDWTAFKKAVKIKK